MRQHVTVHFRGRKKCQPAHFRRKSRQFFYRHAGIGPKNSIFLSSTVDSGRASFYPSPSGCLISMVSHKGFTMAKEANKPMTKSALLAELAEATSLQRKQIAQVFDELHKVIKKEMGKKGPGVLN